MSPVRMGLLLALVVGGAAWERSAGAQDDPERRTRLQEIRSEIEAREQRAEALQTQADSKLAELDAIDRQLHELRVSMRRLRNREREAEQELGEARDRLGEARRSHESAEREVRRRLIALYKYQAVNAAPPLARATDVQQALHVGRGMGQVLEADQLLFARFAETRKALAASRDRAEALRDEVASARALLARRQERGREKAVERRNLVALLRSRADRERRGAEELRAAAARLEAAIARMPRGGPEVGDGLDRGRVPTPVEGPLRLGFGRQVDPEFGTETLRNGVEFAASRGDPVRAVARGRVLFAGWFQGYGQVVIVDHGQGAITVSGYLDEVSVAAEDVVAAGEVIGTVGETGSLEGPGLYFEVRADGKPVDPTKWLDALVPSLDSSLDSSLENG